MAQSNLNSATSSSGYNLLQGVAYVDGHQLPDAALTVYTPEVPNNVMDSNFLSNEPGATNLLIIQNRYFVFLDEIC